MVLGVTGTPLDLAIIPREIRQGLGPVTIQDHLMVEMTALGTKMRL